ncbi:MAG: SET domain-containing protein [Flavobacteriaceae bacterium]
MNISKDNWRPLPDFLSIQPSKIDGLGLFALEEIPAGTDLGMSHIHDERFPDEHIRLPLGAFINHHEIPNCKAVLATHDDTMGEIKHVRIVTLQKIEKGSELNLKYIFNILEQPNWGKDYDISQ